MSRFSRSVYVLSLDALPLSVAVRDVEGRYVLVNRAWEHYFGVKREDALANLERAVRNGFGHKESMANDPDLESIRRTPWFHAIVQAMTPG